MLGSLIDMNAAARGVDCSLQQVVTGLAPYCGAHPPTGEHDHQVQNGDGDQREDGDFWNGHTRLLVLIVCGRSGSVATKRAK